MATDLKKTTGVAQTDIDVGSLRAADISALNEAEKSLAHTRFEHSLGFWQAVKHYRPALLWAAFVNLSVILCGFDGALIGSLVGLSPFTRTYGRLVNGEYQVAPSWLSAFNYAAMLGSMPGSLTAGMAYDKFGPRICLEAASTASIGFIFLQFFSQGPALLFVGELLNGLVLGAYPVLANAYIGDVSCVPAYLSRSIELRLRKKLLASVRILAHIHRRSLLLPHEVLSQPLSTFPLSSVS